MNEENDEVKNKKLLYLFIGIACILAIICGVSIGTIVALMKGDFVLTNSHVAVEKTDISNNDRYNNIKKQQNKNEISVETVKENYSDKYKEYLELSDEEKKDVAVVPRKDKVDYEELDKIVEEQKDKDSNIPAKFDLREKIPVKVENQEDFGLCWDFAGMKSVETNLALTQGKDYDFSEIHIDYLTSNVYGGWRDIHEGGNFEDIINYNLNYGGFVLQDKLEYRDYSEEEYNNFLNIDKVEENIYDIVNFPSYNKEDEWSEEEFNKYQSAIKTHIMNSGSLYAVIKEPNYDQMNLYYPDAEWDSSHAVSIIGWDDNYSKDNFRSNNGKVPEKNGAYIALNSWGEEYGDKGAFYISYEDSRVHSELSGVVSTSVKDLIDLSKIDNLALANAIEEEFPEYIVNYNNNKYVRNFISKEYVVDFSNKNLKSLKGIEIFKECFSLNLSNNSLSSLKGIENLKQLDSLEIGNNNLTSIEELRGLPICSLVIDNNNVSDVSCLEESSFISYLSISNNKGISGYENLNTLMNFEAKNCDIKNVGFLANLDEAYTIDLSGNKNIVDLDTLKKSNITTLILEDCNIKDIGMIVNPKLFGLNLSNNKELTNFEALNSCNDLNEIILKDCNITDASILKSVTIMDLSGNVGIKNLDKLENTENLTLERCNLDSLEEISKLSRLMALNVASNNITDVTPISKTNIDSLNVSNNKGLTGNLKDSKVRWLQVENCNLNNDFNFFDIQELPTLNIRNNNIDINELINKGMKFEWIDIDEFNIEDMDNIPENTCICPKKMYLTIEVPSLDEVARIKWPYYEIKNIYNCEVEEKYQYLYCYLNEDSKIILENVSDDDCKFWAEEFEINFKVNPDMQYSVDKVYELC